MSCVCQSFSSRILLGLFLLILSLGVVVMGPGTSAGATGSIIVDPDHPQWFKRDSGNSFFLCGPGDPENFLYRGSRNSDGTRNGDQMTLINKLKANGGNSIYFQMYRVPPGDGDATHHPFLDKNNPAQGVNTAILEQWETWFDAMDQAGILIYAFFYDDSAKVAVWGGGDSVPADEAIFLRHIVNSFEHHQHLVWVIAEEYQEAFTRKRVSTMADIIRTADDNNHPIAVHKLGGLSFTEFANDSNMDQHSIQYNNQNAQGLHNGMVSAFNNAAGRYNITMAESAGHAGSQVRKKNWAVAMGGAYVMVFQWDIAGTSPADLRDCGRLVQFMETTNFAQMSPSDGLKFGGTQYVLADPTTDSYILYASALSGQIGVQNLGSGTYDLHWLDIPSGTTVDETGISVGGGDVSFPRPPDIGSSEVAVWVRLSQGPPVQDTNPPTVSLTAPLNNASVSGTVTISADAADTESGVAGVQFFVDGVQFGAPDNTFPYSILWNTAPLPLGMHTISAQVTDNAGNSTGPVAPITVSVAATQDMTPPTVVLTSPAQGSNLTGTVLLTASATDTGGSGVAGVQFMQGTTALGAEDVMPPYEGSWDTTLVQPGAYTLHAVARDGADNTTVSPDINVNVPVGNVSTVPNVVGQLQGDAASAISGAGLVVGAVTTESSTIVPADNVISQDPVANTEVAPDSAVNLVVSSGPTSVLDVVVITEAVYKPDKDEFKIRATSNGSPNAILAVLDFGQMTFKSKKNRYELNVNPLSPRSPPSLVTVVSSLGGSATSPVAGAPTPTLPGQASNPNPADGTTNVSITTTLSWTAGVGSTSSVLYFGNDPGALVSEDSPAGTTFDPGLLALNTTYFWQIDEVNAQGTTAGAVWSFTTEAAPLPPGQATNPNPSNGATGISVNTSLSWMAGLGSGSHNVYFGTNPTPGIAEAQGNQTGTTFNPGTLLNNTIHFWRIDEVNAQGITTGPVWSFTTEPVSASDVVTISKAKWDSGKQKLSVKATSSAQPSAVLTVEGFGQMTFKTKKNRYELKVTSVNSSPGTVTVTSSGGGSASAGVTIK